MLTAADARRLQDCLRGGGVAVLPSDTVYGLACDPHNEQAVRRLYALKGRPPRKPTAVMFFALELAMAELTELTAPERAAARALLPGPVTLLLPNPRRRFPLAGGPQAGVLGVRVPRLAGPLGALAGVRCAALASSANLAGAAKEPRCLEQVPAELRRAADLALDGGELPGTASTVVDLCHYASSGDWRVVRPGALSEAQLRRDLGHAGCVDVVADP